MPLVVLLPQSWRILASFRTVNCLKEYMILFLLFRFHVYNSEEVKAIVDRLPEPVIPTAAATLNP